MICLSASMGLEREMDVSKGFKLLHRATINTDVWHGGGGVEVAG